MNVFNRLLGILVSAALLFAGVVLLLLITKAADPEAIGGKRFEPELASIAAAKEDRLAANYGIAIGLIVGGVVLLIVESRPLLAGPRMVLVSGQPEGVVRVSLDSITELAERTGREHRYVNSVRCRVHPTSAGLRIRCQANLNMGSDVPAVSTELQSSVKEVVERLVGLNVIDVAVRAKYTGGGDVALLAR